MLVDYFYWQYVWSPRFLLRIMWNLQRALWRFFSVKYMLRTLLAHWHKDAIPYHGGSPSKLILTFIWNIVSRFIGLVIRVGVIAVWFIIEITYIPFAAVVFLLFIGWPVAVLASLIFGVHGLLV